MAAIIRIEVKTEGNVDAVKQNIADIGRAADEAGGHFSAFKEIGIGALRAVGEGAIGLAVKGFQAIGGAISDGITDAKNYAIIAAQTEAVIKSTGGAAGVSAQHVADYAASLSDAAGKSLFGDDQIQQSTNLLLTFSEIKGTVLDAATAISVDMAQAMGGAPKDAAIQLGKALNDPVKGITALTRVGVVFTEEQKAQIQAMQEAGDTAGAQAVILAELNKEFGGSAAAAAAATGGWSEFEGRMGEAKETLGAAVLPLLNTLSSVLLSDVLPVVESAANAFAAWLSDPATQQGIQQIADAITTGLGVAFDFLTQTAIPALLTAWAFIQPAIAAILPLFSSELPGALGTASGVFTQLQSTINTVMQGVQAVIGAVLPVITEFWRKNGADIMAFVQEAWNRIMEIIRTALQLIQAIVGPALQFIANFISAHGEQIQALLTNTWNAIKAAIDIALTLIQGVIKVALQLIQGDWSGAWETVKTTLSRVWEDLKIIVSVAVDNLKLTLSLAWDAIKGKATEMWDLIKGAITTAKDDIVKALEELPGKALEIGGNIIDGIIDGVNNAAGALYDTLRDMASSALDAAKDVLGITSPSQVFANEVGEPIMQGLIVGVQGMIPGLVGVLDDVALTIISHAKKVTEKVVDEANKIQDALLDQAEGIADKLSGVMADALTGTASLDRAKAKAIAALKDITAAQQEEVQKQLTAASATAGGFGDPKQAAAFFKMRSDQIFELAKLKDQIDKTTDEAAKARLVEQYNLIGKAQQTELQAFDVKGGSSALAGITAQLQALLASPNLPGALEDKSGVLGQLFAALPQLVAMTTNAGPGAVNSTNTSSFTYAPTVNTTSNIPPWLDWTTAKALSGV